MVKMYSRPQTVNVSAGSENYSGKQNRENRDSKSRDLGSSPSAPGFHDTDLHVVELFLLTVSKERETLKHF